MKNIESIGDLWSMLPGRLEKIVAARAAGDESVARQAPLPRVRGAVAVITIGGVMTPRGSEFFGGTSCERCGMALDAAVASKSIKGIVLDVDSPGGSVYGTPELGDKIFNARGTKPIVAVANPMAASAAYWIASAAEKLIVTPSGDVGSIGVWSLHEDWSKHLDEFGVKLTFVSAGPYKVEGNFAEPLGDEAREEMQRRVDAYYDQFTSAVARNRGVPKPTVKAKFGGGRMVAAASAVSVGMADRVASFEQVLQAMGVSRSDGTMAQDEADTEYLVAAFNGELESGPEPVEPAAVESHGDPDLLRRRMKLRKV